MKLCHANERPVRGAEPAPTAVPAGLFMMGMLLTTFEYPLTVLFGIVLAVWGAANLAMRGRRLACCLRSRRQKMARGEAPAPCTMA